MTTDNAPVNQCPQVEPAYDSDVRPFRDLMEDTGLLWLINRTVFHPRGYALALVFADEDRQQPVGWQMVGDGTQVWLYDPAEAATEAERFRSVTRMFDQLREQTDMDVQAAIAELVELGLVEYVPTDEQVDAFGRLTEYVAASDPGVFSATKVSSIAFAVIALCKIVDVDPEEAGTHVIETLLGRRQFGRQS